jgi:hypothetical protein
LISHTFVDESKRRDYLLIAATVEASDLDRVRKHSIAATIAGSGITATVYDAGRRYPTELERRAACLAALVDDAAVRGDERLLPLWSRTTHCCPGTTNGSSKQPAPPGAGTRCGTSTARPPPSTCSPCRT